MKWDTIFGLNVIFTQLHVTLVQNEIVQHSMRPILMHDDLLLILITMT